MLRWLLYQRKDVWLMGPDWYTGLSLATGRDGWEVVRAHGACVQLKRRRWRLP